MADAGGGVGDPALVAVDAPVGLEVVDGLVEVVGGGVDRGVVAGAAEGDVGELAAAAGGEDVGSVVGGALGAVHGEGVAVVEVRGVEAFAVDADCSAVGGDGVDVGLVEAVMVSALAGDDPRRVGLGARATIWSPTAYQRPGATSMSSP